MALGGGYFTSTNKILPGSYINFVSSARVAQVGTRGNVACPLELDWGPENEVIPLNTVDIADDALTTLGYDYDDVKLAPVRELFKHAIQVYAYRLNGGGVKASNTYAEAKYSGTRGNDLTIAVQASIDTDGAFDVVTRLDGVDRDTQTVTKADELIDNDYVTFKKDATLEVTAGTPLTGGTNSDVTGENHTAFLNAVDGYSFNVLACPSTDAKIIALYEAYEKRMREEMGVKFQTVIPGEDTKKDYEGIITVANTITDAGAKGHEMVYWTAGAEAACALNRTLTNATYDGEYEVDVSYTQAQLEAFIQSGVFVFHRVGNGVRVLEDVNSLTTYTKEKRADFGKNKTIRVIDAIATDIAAMFNDNYLGLIPNDVSGRNSLKADIVKHHNALQNNGTIEGFDASAVTIERGSKNTQVIVTDAITITGMMEQLYMTVTVN